jgi:hypothetical protein
MMGQVVELPNMQWRRRRILRNATTKFLRSEEYKAVQERNKAAREEQIAKVFGEEDKHA